MKDFSVQTRGGTPDGELREYASLTDAMKAAEEDHTIWKISFPLATGERVRLVKSFWARGRFNWMYEPILPYTDYERLP